MQSAVRYLHGVRGISVVQSSHVVETPAWGYSSEHKFLNAMLEINCALADSALDSLLHDCEVACGRIDGSGSAAHYDDRIIDVDLIWLDAWQGKGSRLIIPHPQAHQRAFVLQPLEELAPDLQLAGYGLGYWIDQLEPEERDSLTWRRDLNLWSSK